MTMKKSTVVLSAAFLFLHLVSSSPYLKRKARREGGEKEISSVGRAQNERKRSSKKKSLR